ncbi:MAG: prolyl oligopeptidase family serine peptidase [Spirochaetes bacterium]|nr:prolyl oligopeptidase family serine peptidase [Spirochaetota bacterium]
MKPMHAVFQAIMLMIFTGAIFAADIAPGISIADNGIITLGGVSIFAVVSETGTAPTFQADSSIAPGPGFPAARDGEIELRGTFTVSKSKQKLSFSETVTKKADGIILTYRIEQVPAEFTDVRLAFRMPLSSAGRPVIADGKQVLLPREAKEFQIMPDTSLTELILPAAGGSVRVTGPFIAFMHDRRKTKNDWFEARAKFTRDGTAAALTVTVNMINDTNSKGAAMNDNNYMVEATAAVGDKKKTGDKKYMPPLAGKNITVSEKNMYSPGRDLVYYESSRTPGLELAMLVTKPEKPSPLLATTHGWHMDIGGFSYLDKPAGAYFRVTVDMRGRKYSQGKQDCNGYELHDVYDAINYAKILYREYITNPDVIYFDAGSGGGGNAYGIIGKFPDLFAACTALCGISDYAFWYSNDTKGEFRDEMDPWIGGSPDAKPMAYRSRSGLTMVENLITPLYIAHGDTDPRVTVDHARRYVARAKELGKESLVTYYELPGVGDADHFGKATKEQRDAIGRGSEENRQKHRTTVIIPRKGRMIVCGYLVTKQFAVYLDSVDKVAVLDYDIDADLFTVTCDVPCTHEIKKFFK